MKLNIAGKRALITGAGSGIGAGIARFLAEEGVKMVLSARSGGGVNQVADSLERSTGHRPTVILADLARKTDIDDLSLSAMKALDGIDILINCAGGSRPLPLHAGEDEWHEALMLNFTSCRLLSQHLLPPMLDQQWGRIVNITGAMEPRSLNGANTAKGALHLWSKGVSCDVASRGVTVNCVAPGRINSTQILEKLHPTEESRDSFIKQNIPAGKFGNPEDIGYLVGFLCSPLAHYITGAVIPVDGGMHYFAH